MRLRTTVAGKHFKVYTPSRRSPVLRLASVFLLALAVVFIFFDFRATNPPEEPLVPIDDSPTTTDPEFADLPGVKNPPHVVPDVNSPHEQTSFTNGLEVGAHAREWTKEDGPRPIPLPPYGAPVMLPKSLVPPPVRQSAWTPPMQPTTDISRRITTDDLQTMFGILPTNRTLVDQRMMSRLQEYDIRNDEHFRDLATRENLTDIFARYHHISRRGWGSMLPTDRFNVQRDHLYYVRHSGDATKGFAVYAAMDIPASTILGSYGGELVEGSEISDGQYAWEAPVMTLLDPVAGAWKKHNMALDASRVGNLLRFVNDLGNEWKNVDATWVPIDNRWNMFYFTTRSISANDELSISYGDVYWGVKSETYTADEESHTGATKGTPLQSGVRESQAPSATVEYGHDERSDTNAVSDTTTPGMVEGGSLEEVTNLKRSTSDMGTDHGTSIDPHEVAEGLRGSSLRKIIL